VEHGGDRPEPVPSRSSFALDQSPTDEPLLVVEDVTPPLLLWLTLIVVVLPAVAEPDVTVAVPEPVLLFEPEFEALPPVNVELTSSEPPQSPLPLP
jgi:hypothetical protein